jgi:predicted HAD superfamily Cof-like phosphohydrolase
MKSLENKVREFRKLFRLTFGDTPAIREPHLQARMLLEECFETVQGLVGIDAAATAIYQATCAWRSSDNLNGAHLPDVADGLVDLMYIATGTAQACGIDLDPVLDAVHAANMAKVNGPVVNGKLGKPPGWTPPDVAAVLRAQGWDGKS